MTDIQIESFINKRFNEVIYLKDTKDEAGKILFVVPYKKKEQFKSMGGRWDGKNWYISGENGLKDEIRSVFCMILTQD